MKLSGEYFVQVEYNRPVQYPVNTFVKENYSMDITFNFNGDGYELVQYIRYAMGLNQSAQDIVVLCMVKGD